MTMMLLKDTVACHAVVEELHPLAERNKFPWHLGDALFFRGWVAAIEKNDGSGIEPMMHSAYLPLFAPFRSFYVIQIAEAALRAGQLERATATLDRAAEDVEVGANRFCEPEIHRLRGEVLLAQSRDNVTAAQQAFREAMALAARQSCPILELRAANSLARLFGDERRRDELVDLLAPLYAKFTEGFDKSDLLVTKALLAEVN
jgi:predicted ATPase